MSAKIHSLSDFLALLKGVKPLPNGQYTAFCPCHDDLHQSLAITLDGDRILLYCHAVCTIEQILATLNLTKTDLFLNNRKPKLSKPRQRKIDCVYHYTDANGKPFETEVLIIINQINQNQGRKLHWLTLVYVYVDNIIQ